MRGSKAEKSQPEKSRAAAAALSTRRSKLLTRHSNTSVVGGRYAPAPFLHIRILREPDGHDRRPSAAVGAVRRTRQTSSLRPHRRDAADEALQPAHRADVREL